jgi:threonine/homoserine/homoserine lactone efflux protein
VQEAAARGFGASARVILGSATADLLLVGPALAASWLIAEVDALAVWVGLIGAAYFVYLAFEAARDSRRLWLGGALPGGGGGWAFAKGVLGNLTNPLAWAFWLATGTPTMLRVEQRAGWPGLAVFTVVWFVVAMAVEAVVALVVVRTGKALGGKSMAGISAASAGVFFVLAGLLVGSAAH